MQNNLPKKTRNSDVFNTLEKVTADDEKWNLEYNFGQVGSGRHKMAGLAKLFYIPGIYVGQKVIF